MNMRQIIPRYEYKTEVDPCTNSMNTVIIIKAIAMITIIIIIIEKSSLFAILNICESQILTNCDRFTTSPYLEP